MKIENIPAEIKSKSLKEAKDEINEILTKLESKDFDLSSKKIIMPGVGSFDAFVDSLKDKNLFGTIKNLVLKVLLFFQ